MKGSEQGQAGWLAGWLGLSGVEQIEREPMVVNRNNRGQNVNEKKSHSFNFL